MAGRKAERRVGSRPWILFCVSMHSLSTDRLLRLVSYAGEALVSLVRDLVEGICLLLMMALARPLIRWSLLSRRMPAVAQQPALQPFLSAETNPHAMGREAPGERVCPVPH